jgi:hypothetical protein
MAKVGAILDQMFKEAEGDLRGWSIPKGPIANRVEFVATCLANRAGVRLIMSCMLAKIVNPAVDPREPITEIGSNTCFSGRTYDEQHLTDFIIKYHLPCNNTTAFLTPAFRNFTKPFLLDSVPKGRPPKLYTDAFQLLEDVAKNRVTARAVFVDTLRHLIAMRNEQSQRMESLLGSIRRTDGTLAPSSEAIAKLLEQHLSCKNSARLPVLGVAAAYAAVAKLIGERALALKGHNAADIQTGASGDVQICLANENDVVTVYEMKKKPVIRNDIDHALTKIVAAESKIDNYIIVTTDPIAEDVAEYARSMYDKTDGVELVVLDYLGFIRHFLHFFHRYRREFLDSYQALVLAEPASSVPQSLKEAFLALRSALQSDETITEQGP